MEKREKFILWCDKVMAFSFYALIYFLPISIALSESFTVLALVCFFLKRGAIFYGRLKELPSNANRSPFLGKIACFFESFKPVSSFLSWPIVFLLLISVVSILFSQYRLTSLNGFLGKVLQSVFIYFNFIECMSSKKRLRIFLNVFFVSYTLICINGIFQAYYGHGFIHGNIFEERISSSFRSANDLAAYLIVVIPILFSLVFLIGSQRRNGSKEVNEIAYSGHRGFKIAYLVLFLLGFICLGFTYSRGAWVGFVISLLLMGLFGFRNFKVIISNCILIVFFLVIFWPGAPNLKIPSRVNHAHLESSPSSTEKSSLLKQQNETYLKYAIGGRFSMINTETFLNQNNRFGYWRRSFKIIKDYPIFGCGLNAYALVAGRYSVGWGGYPHNSYLQMAAETGFIGLIIFLWILFVLFRESIRALRRIKTQEFRILLFGFLTGLLGFLIHSFFDTNLYSVQLSSFLWVIIGVIVALQRVEKT